MPSDLIDRISGIRSSLAVKAPCRVATTVNVTLSGLQTIDGVALTVGDRVLVKGQTDAKANGVYKASTGNWQRDKDFDATGDVVEGTRVYVHSGTLGAGEFIVTTADPIVIDTSSISFSILPASTAIATTDNAVARYDGTGGTLQNSGVLIDDSNNVSGLTSFAVGTNPASAGALRLANVGWITGRNAANNADLNMFRVNSANFTEFSNPMYYDDTSTPFIDRKAVFHISRDTAAPTAINPNFWSQHIGKGNNTTQIGVSGGFIQARDRTDVTALNKGCLYGLQIDVHPIVDRNNFPFDDAVPLVISNSGTARATEAVYVGHNVQGGGRDFAIGFSCEAHTLEAAFNAIGTHGYGLDFCRNGNSGTTFTSSAIRIPNNTNIVSKNAANSADVPMLKLATDDSVLLRDGVVGIYPTHVVFLQPGVFPNAGLRVFDTDASHQLQITPGSNLTANRVLIITTGDANKTLDISAASVTISTFGASLVDDATAGDARTTLGLGTVAVQNTGTSGANVPLMNGTNTWSAQQTFTLSTSFAIPLILASTNADAVTGPIIFLDRQSASPTANDNIGAFNFQGRDSNGNSETYAQVGATIADATDGSEDGQLFFLTVIGGSSASRMTLGAGLMMGSATDQGPGTLNLDNALYRDGTQVVGARIAGYAAMTGTANRGTSYATGTITLAQLAERMKALQDDLTTHGLIGA